MRQTHVDEYNNGQMIIDKGSVPFERSRIRYRFRNKFN